MQTDLFGSFKARGGDWTESDQNLIYVSLPGIDLRPEVQRRGQWLCEQLDLDGLRPERVLHTTVCHFGHYGHIPDAVAAAREIGQEVAVRRSEIILDQYGSFFHPSNANPFVLAASRTSDSLKLLNKELVRKVRRLGLECPTGINAHATLLYGSQLAPFTELAPPIIWPFDELVLIMSRRGTTEHVIIDRWPAAEA